MNTPRYLLSVVDGSIPEWLKDWLPPLPLLPVGQGRATFRLEGGVFVPGRTTRIPEDDRDRPKAPRLDPRGLGAREVWLDIGQLVSIVATLSLVEQEEAQELLYGRLWTGPEDGEWLVFELADDVQSILKKADAREWDEVSPKEVESLQAAVALRGRIFFFEPL